jgi:hypothetical protein
MVCAMPVPEHGAGSALRRARIFQPYGSRRRGAGARSDARLTARADPRSMDDQRPTRQKQTTRLPRVAWSTSSLSRVLFRTEIALDAAAVIPLGRPLPDASSSLPADSSESPSTTSPPLLRRIRRTSAYVALLPMGSALPSPLPEARWALTPPFHPGLPLVSVAGRARQVVSSLLHFPSRSHDRALPGIVLFGARTFLPPRFVAPIRLAAYRSDWFTTGDRLYGIDGRQGATGSLAPQCGGCVSWGG